MLLMIDNYDSFTYNVVQYLGELGAEVQVVRNDEITVVISRYWHLRKLLFRPGRARQTKRVSPWRLFAVTLGWCLCLVSV